MAPRPARRGISRSSVTTSGLCSWILRSASSPSRAVATTRNSPVSASPPPNTSTSTRRMSALSSAMTTVGLAGRSDDGFTGPYRPDLHAAVFDVKPDAAAALATHRLAHDGYGGGAQRGASGQHVALAHLDRARRDELAEHAGDPGPLGAEAHT